MKNKNIKLVYWNEPNFGDLLSPYIIKKLTGNSIIHKKGFISRKRIITDFFRNLLRLNFSKISSILFPWERNILAIGSILNLSNSNSLIWGSGFMYENQKFHGGKIYALRGPYSNNIIKKMGYKGCNIFGDPALLLPLVAPINQDKTHEIGIIPHWSETEFFKKEYGNKYHIIDFRTNKIEETIENITSCKYILSTSLHGIIVSQAYGIPALWIKKGKINTDGIKFKDYFASVNIIPYNGFENINEILSDEKNIKDLFIENTDKSCIKCDLKHIQKQLLEAAPFKINQEFQI